MTDELIEYRVKPVTRYVVTRFERRPDSLAGVTQRGEYGSADVAYEVAYALAKHDHEEKGWRPGDERIQYPQHPSLGRQITLSECNAKLILAKLRDYAGGHEGPCEISDAIRAVTEALA